MRRFDMKNFGWLISTILDRIALIMLVHDNLVLIQGNEIPDTFIWKHTLIAGLILAGWVWSIWRNGIQLSVIPYLIKWNERRMDKIRKKRIIFIDSRDIYQRRAK